MKNYFVLILICFLTGFAMGQKVESEPGIYNFIENKGQWPETVLYRANIEGGKIWLEKDRILYQFVDFGNDHHANLKSKKEKAITNQHLICAKFLNASSDFQMRTANPSSVYYNYFIGNDRSKWTSHNRSFNQVEYQNLYPGINLSLFEKEGQLKYEYHVNPGIDYRQILIGYDGYDKIKKQKNGNIVIYSSLGEIIEQKPYVYQIKNGKIIEIESEFELSENGVISFKLGEYDKDIKLVIDPVLVFATYNGAHSDNFGMTATYAYDGKAYSGGIVFGNAYPTPVLTYDTLTNFTGQSTGQYGITDVFVTKYSEDGTNMLWTTFIGGGNDTIGTETVHSLICDQDNNIYLYGATSSLDFPVVGGFQGAHGGGTPGSNFFSNGVYYTTNGTDIYVAKFSDDGMNLLGSTYIGGSANDGINYKVTSGIYNNAAHYDSLTTNYGDQFRGEIMLDSLNNILVASSTRSADFPVANNFQTGIGGQQDGIVFKVASDFSSLLWSSFYGGTENDACYSVKIDSSYNILIAGGTSSSDLPGTTGGLNPTYLGGKTDGFVAKISPDGANLVQGTYIGTSTYDQTIFVEIDRFDNVFITGVSDGNMPVINAAYSNPNSGQFIMKLNPALTTIDYATVFGNGSGAPNISPAAFLVDICGNVYVSGWGASILQATPLNNMPVSANAFQSSNGDGFNFYLFVMERDAQSLLYGSYIGGPDAQEHVDGGTSRFDKNGVVYQSVCGGCGGHSDFPTTPGAWSADNNSSNCNNLLFRFNFEIVPDANFTTSNTSGCSPFRVEFNNVSTDVLNSIWDFGGNVNVIQGGSNPIVDFITPGDYTVSLTLTDAICGLTDVHEMTITVWPTPELEVSNDTLICEGDLTPIELWANSFGTANNFVWADNISFSNPLNSGAMDSTISIIPDETTVYYVRVSNGISQCDVIDSVVVQTSNSAVDLTPDTQMCLGDTLTLFAQITDGVTLDWRPNEFIIEEENTYAKVSPEESQYYYVYASIGGCEIIDSVWVEVFEMDFSAVDAIAFPTEVAEGGKVELTALPDVDNYTYSWTPASLIENPLSRVTSTLPLSEDTQFSVDITDGVCSTKSTVFVRVLEFVCGDVYVFVPNAFSPNGDNQNEKVFVRGQNIEEITFKIFDRWGEKVFESNDQSLGWDGTFRDEQLNPDVYVYHLKVICVDGQENLIKGNITLLR